MTSVDVSDQTCPGRITPHGDHKVRTNVRLYSISRIATQVFADEKELECKRSICHHH